jgi:hypothetical protein
MSCNKTVKGRSDKKFCNDYCRNAYNNVIKSSSNNLVRNLNNRLSKNRRILENILEDKKYMIKIKKDKLEDLGFDFDYTTQVRKNKLGSHYYYCYEYGYIPINKEWLVLIRNEYI